MACWAGLTAGACLIYLLVLYQNLHAWTLGEAGFRYASPGPADQVHSWLIFPSTASSVPLAGGGRSCKIRFQDRAGREQRWMLLSLFPGVRNCCEECRRLCKSRKEPGHLPPCLCSCPRAFPSAQQFLNVFSLTLFYLESEAGFTSQTCNLFDSSPCVLSSTQHIVGMRHW